MLDEQKLQELTKDFNESFEEIKSEFLKLTTDELNALKIHELVKAATDIGQLFGEATILFRMGLITVEKYNFTVRMTNIIDSHAKIKDLVPSTHEHLKLTVVKEAMKNQFHATLLEMSKKAEACTYCQGIFVRAAALT